MVQSVSRYRWVILVTAFVCEWCNALAFQAIAPLAPLFQPELGLSKAEVGFFSSAAFLGAWGVLLFSGPLTDRLGPRKVASVGLMATGVMMMSMSMVGSFLQAAAVMLAAGVGRGIAAPGATKGVSDWFPPSMRGTAMGIKQTGMPVSGIFAASVLPALALVIGWRGSVGVVGALVFAGGVVALLLFRDAGQTSRVSTRSVGMWTTLRQVARNGYLWRMSTMALLFVTVQLSLIAYLALYFADVVLPRSIPDEGLRVVAAGGYLAACQAGGVAGRIFWGLLSDRVFHGRRVVVMVMVGALMALLSVVMGYLDSEIPPWLLVVVVFGIGLVAVGWPGLYQAVVVETVGRKYAATAVGLNMTVTQFGKVVGPPLFGFIVDVSGSWRLAWILLGGVAAGGTLIALVSAKSEKHID